MKYSLLFLLCFLLASPVYTQKLISATQASSHTQAELISNYNLPAALTRNGSTLYKVLYKTSDIHGMPDTASGLVVIPDVVGEYPLLCYQHGTANDRSNVPSVINPDGYPNGDPIGVIFSAFGYVVAAPDFLGLGDSDGFHPYVHLETEASAAIDLLFATEELMETQSSSLNDQLFISGYSQGGHAAMAAHQKIQEDFSNDFTVTASAPMSGPYSISGVMTDLILQDEEYFFAAYIPNTFLSYNLAYDLFDETEEYFKQPYAATIDSFYREEIGLFELNIRLINQLISQTGGSFPKTMLQDSILAVATDDTHPLSIALRANDNTNWVPEAPTRLFYCTADDQVPFRNSIVADSIFQLNNVSDLLAIDVDTGADHGGCVNPAVTNTLFFFLQYQNVQVSTDETILVDQTLKISPNPVRDFVDLQWEGKLSSLELYDTYGKLLRQVNIDSQTSQQLEVSDLPTGMYFLLGRDGDRKVLKKMVKE